MEKVQTDEKYYRQNGGVLDQKTEISAVRRQQLKDAIRNNRLGRYNAYGRYTLSPAVTKELLSITKYIYKDHFDEVIKESKGVLEFRASSYLPVFGEMQFRIVFKDKFAKLYLIENVYREFNGYQEIYGEQITEINCEDNRADVVDYVLSLLNISVTDSEDEGKKPEEDAEKVKAILFDKLYLSMVSRNYLKGSASDEKDTFEDMVRILKEEGGDYGKKVLKHFIDRIEKRPDIMQLKDEDGYNEALNDALIGAMEVATNEDDMRDPHIKKVYDDIYKKRFEKTDEHTKKAQEEVNEKDFAKVAEGVLGKKAPNLFKEDEIREFMGEKGDLVVLPAQEDLEVKKGLEEHPILKKVVAAVAGKVVTSLGKGKTDTHEQGLDAAPAGDLVADKEQLGEKGPQDIVADKAPAKKPTGATLKGEPKKEPVKKAPTVGGGNAYKNDKGKEEVRVGGANPFIGANNPRMNVGSNPHQPENGSGGLNFDSLRGREDSIHVVGTDQNSNITKETTAEVVAAFNGLGGITKVSTDLNERIGDLSKELPPDEEALDPDEIVEERGRDGDVGRDPVELEELDDELVLTGDPSAKPGENKTDLDRDPYAHMEGRSFGE